MKAFFHTAGLCLRKSSYFGLADLVGMYAVRIIGTLAMLMIWGSIASDGGDLGGMTLQQLLTYTLLTSILAPMLDVRTPVSSWLHEGTLQSLYQRPTHVLLQLISMTLGGWGTHLIVMSIPLALMMPLLGGTWVPASLWFFPSLVLAVVQGFCVDFMYACLIIRAKNMSWQIESMRNALSALLTGAVIPFALLPFGIGDVLALSPLGTLAGATLSIYTGLGDPSVLLPAQLLWTAILIPLSTHLFQKSSERMVSYGG